MSKSIYEEALSIIDKIYGSDTIEGHAYYAVKRLPPAWEVNMDELEKMKHALKQGKKQEKLLILYEKLSEHRLNIIHELLNKIASLTIDKDFELEVRKYGDKDSEIIIEIEKIKELSYE